MFPILHRGILDARAQLHIGHQDDIRTYVTDSHDGGRTNHERDAQRRDGTDHLYSPFCVSFTRHSPPAISSCYNPSRFFFNRRSPVTHAASLRRTFPKGQDAARQYK
jgi:hypothetical protein